MSVFNRLDRSAARVQGMAQRVGADLGAVPGGEPDAYAFRSMVLKCAGCACPEACDSLQASATHFDAPPAYCRNRDRLG